MRFARVNFSGDHGLAAAGAVFDPKSLFGSAPPPPPVPPPVAMPDPLSPDTLAAKRKATDDMSRSGRAATTLTKPAATQTLAAGGSDKLGSST